MLTPQRKVCWFAIFTRVFIIILSTVFNFIIPDHNADAFKSPQDPNNNVKLLADHVIMYVFGGLLRWDAQYFIHIAQYGYTYENCLAFFPLFPLSVRVLGEMLYFLLQDHMSRYSAIVLSAVIINFVIFVISATVLYRLSLQVLRNEQLAYKASIFYCINPATIFFVAPYSETLYACLTFYGMLKCRNGSIFSSSVGCGLPFGLAAVDRSNGVLNVGFIFHERLKYFLKNVIPDMIKKAKQLSTWFLAPLLLIPPVVAFISFIGEAILSITPFIMFQGYAFYKFCIIPDHNLPDFIISFAEENALRLPGTQTMIYLPEVKDHWCNGSIPLAYSYVQDHYWNVGFLRYYHWKQIPNFLLALPIIWIILLHSYRFVKQYPNLCCTLGLNDDPASSNDPKVLEKIKVQVQQNKMKFSPGMFVYVIHIVFLTIFCSLCIHIQVTTRIVTSSSPVLYWFVSYLYFKPPTSVEEDSINKKDDDRNSVYFAYRLRKICSRKGENMSGKEVDSFENLNSRWKVFILNESAPSLEAKLIKCYFIIYIILGAALFSNFLPWT